MKRNKAFTLVELLVVIGIIAVLVGIILPVINTARKSSTQVACQANLRSLMQGLLGYAAENKGSMPYGFIWNEMNSTGTPINPATTGAQAFHWQSVVETRNTKDKNAGYYPPLPVTGSLPYAKLSKVFRCPEVDISQFSTTPTNYASHMVILPNAPYELNPNSSARARLGLAGNLGIGAAGTKYSIAPAKLSQLYNDNSVLWDTTAIAENNFLINRLPGGTWTDIDGAQLCFPYLSTMPNDYQFLRYRGKFFNDPFLDESYPINYPNNHAGVTFTFGFTWVNADSAANGMIFPAQWFGPRWRHGKQNLCNVAFADGSVRSLRVELNKAAYDPDVAPSDWRRKFILIRKPSTLPPP